MKNILINNNSIQTFEQILYLTKNINKEKKESSKNIDFKFNKNKTNFQISTEEVIKLKKFLKERSKKT